MSSGESLQEVGITKRKNIKKFVSKYACGREVGTFLLKFHFSIFGDATAEEKADLKMWLQGILAEHNNPGNPSLGNWYVLVEEMEE